MTARNGSANERRGTTPAARRVPDCPMCGTDERVYLGQLGRLHWWQCRDCGTHYPDDGAEAPSVAADAAEAEARDDDPEVAQLRADHPYVDAFHTRDVETGRSLARVDHHDRLWTVSYDGEEVDVWAPTADVARRRADAYVADTYAPHVLALPVVVYDAANGPNPMIWRLP